MYSNVCLLSQAWSFCSTWPSTSSWPDYSASLSTSCSWPSMITNPPTRTGLLRQVTCTLVELEGNILMTWKMQTYFHMEVNQIVSRSFKYGQIFRQITFFAKFKCVNRLRSIIEGCYMAPKCCFILTGLWDLFWVQTEELTVDCFWLVTQPVGQIGGSDSHGIKQMWQRNVSNALKSRLWNDFGVGVAH